MAARQRASRSLLLVAVLLVAPAVADASHESLAVYEDWTAPVIRADRWFGNNGATHGMRRDVREGKFLRLELRREGATASDTSFAATDNRIAPVNRPRIDHIEVDAMVRRAEVTGCAANPSATRIRPAVLSLGGFNDGTSPAPGNFIGDHFLRIEINREASSPDPEGVLTVRILLFRCTTADCSSASSTNFNPNAGTVMAGARFGMRITWDAPNNRFIAGAGDNPDVILTYDPALNAGPPRGAFITDIRTQAVVGNCTAGPTLGHSKLRIFRVLTNSSAVVE